MKQIIFRVDDRLIHGQVVEGWIKNFHIPRVIIASDRINADAMQQMIYRSVVPAGTTVAFHTPGSLVADWAKINAQKGGLMVLFESVSDLYACRSLLDDSVYINIGCIACRVHSIAVTDTVFLEQAEMEALIELAQTHTLHVKKLPWEKECSSFCESGKGK
jgi:mannose/fructose/N-acetylgalactosamine-specific phosphotransferase system component IIB